MLRRCLFLSLLITVFLRELPGQTYPQHVVSLIRQYSLQPLPVLDTVSKSFPKDLTTISGWHVIHLGSLTHEDGPSQINYCTIFYNDSLLSYTMGHLRPGEISDDTMQLALETNEFLYFAFGSCPLTTTVLVVSKTKNDNWFFFSSLVKADFENGIFVEEPGQCYWDEPRYSHPLFFVTNIRTGDYREIQLSGFNQRRADQGLQSMIYANGVLTITARLKKRRWSLKESTEVREVQI